MVKPQKPALVGLTKKPLADYIETTKRKFKGRHSYVGASEVGLCERKTYYVKSSGRMVANGDVVPMQDSWGAAARGTNFEGTIFNPAMRKAYGENVLYTGKQQKSWRRGNLSATPDAVLINLPRDALAYLMVPDIGPSRCVVIDCKTIDPRIRLSEPKPEHSFQIQAQLGLIRDLTDLKPDYGMVSYTNASFFDDTEEFVIEFNPYTYEQAHKRADRIMNATAASQLRPEGWISGGKECDYCPFAEPCGKLRRPDPLAAEKKADPQTVEYILSLAREEREWSTKCSVADEKARELQHKIKDELRKNHLRRISEPNIKVNWSHVVGRLAYDIPALKKAAEAIGLDIHKFERVGSASDRLTIQVLTADRLTKEKKGRD